MLSINETLLARVSAGGTLCTGFEAAAGIAPRVMGSAHAPILTAGISVGANAERGAGPAEMTREEARAVAASQATLSELARVQTHMRTGFRKAGASARSSRGGGGRPLGASQSSPRLSRAAGALEVAEPSAASKAVLGPGFKRPTAAWISRQHEIAADEVSHSRQLRAASRRDPAPCHAPCHTPSHTNSGSMALAVSSHMGGTSGGSGGASARRGGVRSQPVPQAAIECLSEGRPLGGSEGASAEAQVAAVVGNARGARTLCPRPASAEAVRWT